MKNEKNFLYKKINEAMIIFTILFPVVGIFFCHHDDMGFIGTSPFRNSLVCFGYQLVLFRSSAPIAYLQKKGLAEKTHGEL
ncbi:hypothetical protein AAG663_20430 [Bacillus licheniformis]